MTVRSAAALGVLLVGAAVFADPVGPPVCLAPRPDGCGSRDHRKDAEATRREPLLERAVITLLNLHTREALAVDTERVGSSESRDLERFLRDRTNWETHPIAGECMATIRAACLALGTRRVEIVSGYRSDKLNEMLRKKGHHVAPHSQHVLGRAVDFRLFAVPYAELYAFVRRNHRGGVGAYAGSRFVHVDAGPPRRWSGE